MQITPDMDPQVLTENDGDPKLDPITVTVDTTTATMNDNNLKTDVTEEGDSLNKLDNEDRNGVNEDDTGSEASSSVASVLLTNSNSIPEETEESLKRPIMVSVSHNAISESSVIGITPTSPRSITTASMSASGKRFFL